MPRVLPHRLRFHSRMDTALEDIIPQALKDAQAAGFAYIVQAVLAVQAVQLARPDMTASDALAAVDLMQRK